MAKDVKELVMTEKQQKKLEKERAAAEKRLAKNEAKREKKIAILNKHLDAIEQKYAKKVAKLQAKKVGLSEYEQSEIDHKIGALDRDRLAEINEAYEKYAPKKAVKLPLSDKIYYTLVYIIIGLLMLTVLYPLIYILSCSFSSPSAVAAGRVVLWPVEFSLKGYKEVFTNPSVWIGYRNTILYTVIGTMFNVFMTIICAYPLARKGLPGKGFITFLFTFTMLFSGGLIPTYIVYNAYGMVNNPLVMIIPGAISITNLIISRSFMQSSIPAELLEASQIDGCSDIKYFFSCVIPLSKANIAVITLYYAVGHWNAYWNAYIYFTRRSLFPLQIFLREILLLSQISGTELDAETASEKYGLADLLKFSLIVVATVPILCLYPFIQKFFVKGVMIGSLKG